MPITKDEFVAAFPRLYHMAHEDSWPSIKKHGLLSTSALLDLFNVEKNLRHKIESEHRPEYTKIESPKYGAAMIRDQKPMSDGGLARCLNDGLKPLDWYRILNAKVFLWTSKDRLYKLMSAKAYKKDKHLVLVFSSAALVEDYWSKILFCPMNSGCTRPFAHPRGNSTFLSPAKYPYEDWLSRRPAKEAIVEVAVKDGIHGVDKLIIDRRVISYGMIKSLP